MKSCDVQRNNEVFAFALRWRTEKVIARCSGPVNYDTTNAFNDKRRFLVVKVMSRYNSVKE